MNDIISAITIDLQHPNPDAVIYSCTEDSMRKIQITLLNDGNPFIPTFDSSAVRYYYGMMFRKDGTDTDSSEYKSTTDTSQIPISYNILTLDLDSADFDTDITEEAGTYYVQAFVYEMHSISLPGGGYGSEQRGFKTFPFRVIVVGT